MNKEEKLTKWLKDAKGLLIGDSVAEKTVKGCWYSEKMLVKGVKISTGKTFDMIISSEEVKEAIK